MTTLSTDRLILRRWQSADRLALARINRDPAVMEFYPETLSLEETCQMVERAEAHFDRNGFGPWAAELRETPSTGAGDWPPKARRQRSDSRLTPWHSTRLCPSPCLRICAHAV
jgi:RimJ/RimL family protein N-acetyltransferase